MTSTPAAFGGSSSNWTMHPTGKYFISKNSPWCYNESSGYFYFDNMGRMIRQEEQQQQQQLQSTSTSSTGTPDAPLGTTGSTAQNAIETTPVVIVQKAAPKSMEDGEIQEPNESEKLADLMSKSGYVPMEDPRYFFHAQSGYVYDSITASYSYWDSSSNTYIPVPAQQQKRPQRQVLRPPSADAVLKLVVQESKLLKSGDIIMVTESGLAVGRDRTFEKRLVLNEVAVSRFHCSIHVSREREDIIPDPEPVVETPSSTAKPESTQQHVPPSSSQQPATHGVEPQKEGLQVDYTNALERAHAIAARLVGELRPKDSPVPESSSRTTTPAAAESLPQKEDTSTTATKETDPSPDTSTQNHRPPPHYHGGSYNYHHQHSRHPPRQRLVDYFYITDGGSTHGTYINGDRISESKMSSQPIRLRHGDVLTIGSSVLVAHIHTGLGCDECRMTATNVVALETKKSEKPSAVEVGGEDYINPASIGLSRNGGGGGGQQPKKAELETARLEELKRLKRDALGEEEEETEVSSDKPKKKKKKRKMKEGYIDRAAMRRHMFGPEHTGGGEEHHRPSSSQHQPYETAASHDVAITAVDPTNIGSKLLQKMGWSQGQGLGVSGSGRVDPVNVSMRNGREGLGTAGSSSAPPPSGKRETLYEATMRKARERFSEM